MHSFSHKVSVDLNEVWHAAMTYWHVEAYVRFSFYDWCSLERTQLYELTLWFLRVKNVIRLAFV